MYRGPLPGFYWDEVKRKYFRVQADHYSVAPPNAKYTKANVEKENAESKKRKREENNKRWRKRYLIQRAPVIEIPRATQVGIHRELGCSTRSTILDENAQALTRSLNTKVVLDLRNDAPTRSGYINWRSSYNVSYFDYDSASQGLLLGLSPDNDSSLYDSVVSVLPSPNADTSPSMQEPLWDLTDGARPRYSTSALRPISVFQSPLSSIHLNPRTRTLVTTSTGDKQPPTVQISQLIDPCHAQYSQPLDSGMSSLFRPPNLTTIFCSAFNPWLSSSSEGNIAIGSSGGSGVIRFAAKHDAEGTRSHNWQSRPAMKTYSDVLALDWLSPHLLAAGLRDASVMLYDIRAQSGIKRMKHSGGITALCRADDDTGTLFLCAGMASQLALYDLRALRDTDAAGSYNKTQMIKTPHYAESQKRAYDRSAYKSIGSHETQDMPLAQPLIKFEYENAYDMLGLDVSPELGVVAAAETGGHLRLSSLRTGRTIKRWKLSQDAGEENKIRCVKFVEDDRGVPKLMASCGPRIVELAW